MTDREISDERSRVPDQAEWGALLLRVALGALFLAHAGLKLFVFTPAGTAGFFASLGLPAALAYVTILAEVAGGLALILGLWTRWVALALVPVLLGAIFAGARRQRILVHRPGRRLGVSGVLGGGAGGAVAAGRRRPGRARAGPHRRLPA